MTKSEALEFLELPETATDSEIKIRIEDKLAYFERLSEKAPSDFLKRLHARNAAKVSEIQMQSKKWPSYVPAVEEVVTPEPVVTPEDIVTPEVAVTPESVITSEPVVTPEPVVIPEDIFTPEEVVIPEADPAIGAVIAAGLDPVVEPETIVELDPEFAPGPAPVAWLVRHTENQSAKAFPLYPGKNYLGRKPRPDLVPFIEVEEDPYISKVHAVLYAEKNKLSISDPSGDEGKPSKNGIFINADENRLTEKTRLKEKDTIQVGVTKLILRLNTNALGKIVQEVAEQDYMHTVVIAIS